jgi:hypothetical protein
LEERKQERRRFKNIRLQPVLTMAEQLEYAFSIPPNVILILLLILFLPTPQATFDSLARGTQGLLIQ